MAESEIISVMCSQKGQGNFFFCCALFVGTQIYVCVEFLICVTVPLTSSTIVRQTAPQIDLCPEGICTSSAVRQCYVLMYKMV